MTEQVVITESPIPLEEPVRCTCCAHSFPVSETHSYDCERYCEPCYDELRDEYTFRCVRCGTRETVEYHPAEDPEDPEGWEVIDCDWLCPECHFYCSDCDRTLRMDDYHGDGYCNDCAPHDDDTPDICDDCIDSFRDADPYQIYSYGTKPDYYHFHTDNGVQVDRVSFDTFLGIELEMCFKRDSWNSIAKSASDALPKNYIWKADGSLNDYGAELVTEPATLQAHKRFKWRDLLTKFASCGARSHDTGCCGLHVHISRMAFKASARPSMGRPPEYEVKLQRFFERNKREIVKFSKRKSLNYCQIEDVDDQDFKKAIKLKDKKSGNRYVAVNLDNSGTVEIRIFSGTLNYFRFLASLQFCDALVQFVNTHSLLACSHVNSWHYFCEFCKQRHIYSHMINYFRSKDLCA